LVAETLQVYGRHFWASLPLGLVVAIADQASFGLDLAGRIAVLLVAAPFFSAAFAVGAALVGEVRPATKTWITAILVGTVVFLPAAFLFPWFALAAIVVLALFGNTVPAIVMEERSPLDAVRRSIEVARADLIHALAGLATLVIMFGIVRLAMGFLLRQQADNTLRVAIFLADTVLGPVLFLGAALLFVDLSARVGTTREERLAARRAEHSAAK
jgi:ABC-type transport system involved in cytochrome c biogenesis permease subunit